jgi:hypothetical protein
MPQMLFLHTAADRLGYPVGKACYHYDADGRLWMSLECSKPIGNSELPEFNFCVLRYPLDARPVTGTMIWLPWAQGERDSFEQPSAHAYDGEHHDPWSTRIEILATEQEVLHASGTFLLDGEMTAAGFRPGARHVHFEALFMPGKLEDIWNPGF